MKIGVFDSGIGGMTILDTIKKRLPDEEYYYIADSKNCPYGEKTDAELYKIVKKNVEELRKWGAGIIVIACNTATVRCIDRLRNDFSDVKFVGTEPAVKMALSLGLNKILVLATPGTIKSERMKSLIDGTKVKVDLKACPGLAEMIEQNYEKDMAKIEDKLSELLVKDESYDAVVLGCTHYPLVKEYIQQFYPNARMVDGSDGVAKRVEMMVRELREAGDGLEK